MFNKKAIVLYVILAPFWGGFLSCAQVEKQEGRPARIEPLPEATVESESAPLEIGDSVGEQGVPKVGVILGPGGMKTFAHLGVLQSLVKARVPIDYIVGMGWGSAVAALYAAHGQVFDAEWKMLKLDTDTLPKAGILNKSIRMKSVNVLDGFLSSNFANFSLETSKVPFACPIRSVFNSDVRWIESGAATKGLKACLSAAPYFLPHERQFAAVGALRESVAKIREMGAQVVIFVDVLREGDLVEKSRIDDEIATHMMWTEIRGALKAGGTGVNEVIGIHSRELSMISTHALRDFLRLGKTAGEEAARRMAKKYGF